MNDDAMNADPMNAAHVDFKGLPAVRLRASDGGSATIVLHGAQVVSWVPAGAPEQLYLSDNAKYGPDQAIRGGIPVIFPQFERLGPDKRVPRHGLARTRDWRLLHSGQHTDSVHATFGLNDDAASRAAWPHRFALELTVTLSRHSLEIALTARNPDTATYDFSAALHTYLRVGNIDQVSIDGLSGLTYRDSVLATTLDIDAANAIEHNPLLRFTGETDRIYFDAKSVVRLREPAIADPAVTGVSGSDPAATGAAAGARSAAAARIGDTLTDAGGASLDLTMNGFQDVVVWNPGAVKGAQLNDLPKAGFRHMVCIEAGQIRNPVMLAPGDSWVGRQTLFTTIPS